MLQKLLNPIALAGVNLLAGLLFVLLTPPFAVPDEVSHFYRSTAIAQSILDGRFELGGLEGEVPAGVRTFAGEMAYWGRSPEPRSYAARFHDAWSHELGTSRTLAPFRSAALHTPVPYLPQAAGVLIGLSVNARPAVLFYLGRAANVLVSGLLVLLAVRLASSWMLSLIAVTPMALYLYASHSPDALTIASALLVFASVSAIAERGSSRWRTVTFATSTIALDLSKTAYGLLPLAILATRERGTRALKGFAVGALAGALMVSLIAAADIATDLRGDETADPVQQVRHILGNPGAFARTIAVEPLMHAPRYVREMIGGLGWLDLPVPLAVVIPYGLILLVVALTEPSRWQSPRDRLVLLLLSLMTIFGIVLSQALLWTPVGAETIEGLQGRYFLPVAPFFLAALGFFPAERLHAHRAFQLTLLAITVAANGVAVATVIRHFT